MKQVWDFCEERDLGVSAAHISEKENVQADRESRTEGHVGWELPDDVVTYIVQ